MGLQTNTTLHCKTEDNASITTPAIGPVGTIAGTFNYAAAKFNNGVIATSATDQFKYSRAIVAPNVNKHIVGHWTKWTVNKGAWGGFQTIWTTRIFAVYHGITVGINATGNIQVFKENGAGVVSLINYAGLAFNANDLNNISTVIDNTASFDGIKTIGLYVDGIQIASSANVFNATILNPDIHFMSSWGVANGLQQAYVDNIKCANQNQVTAAGVTEYMNNIPYESFPGVKLLDGGLRSPLIDSGVIN